MNLVDIMLMRRRTLSTKYKPSNSESAYVYLCGNACMYMSIYTYIYMLLMKEK